MGIVVQRENSVKVAVRLNQLEIEEMRKERIGRLLLEASTGMHGEEAKILSDAWCDMARNNEELKSRIAKLEQDAARLDWMQENFICADFRYGEPATEVIVIEIPRGTRVCGDLRVDIDTAMQGA